MNGRALDRALADAHRRLVNIESAMDVAKAAKIDPDDPRYWSEDQIFRHVEEEILEIVQWNHYERNKAPQHLVEKIDACTEYFLQACVRYEQQQSIESWLPLTPEQRYQEKKGNSKNPGARASDGSTAIWGLQAVWDWHPCSVYMRYGNSYASPDKPGCTADRCVPECRFYLDDGRLDDEEIFAMYTDGTITSKEEYAQLKRENNELIRQAIGDFKKQTSHR